MSKFIVKPNQSSLPALTPVAIETSDISIARLIDDGLEALRREVKNLLMLSAKGKLEPSDARDLRDSIKLLFELKDRESESLRGITDEDLQNQVKAALEEGYKDGNK